MLQPAYEAAEKECRSLLVDGKPRSIHDGVTYESAMRDAEVHWTSLQEREYELALQGFSYLKGLNPKEPCFRQALGTVLLGQQKWLDALR